MGDFSGSAAGETGQARAAAARRRQLGSSSSTWRIKLRPSPPRAVVVVRVLVLVLELELVVVVLLVVLAGNSGATAAMLRGFELCCWRPQSTTGELCPELPVFVVHPRTKN